MSGHYSFEPMATDDLVFRGHYIASPGEKVRHLDPNHPEQVLNDVREALRWAIGQARDSGDAALVADIAMRLASLR